MTDNTEGQNSPTLKSLVERIETIEVEVADLNSDKKNVYAEAKATGFEPAILRRIVAERRMDPHKRNEQQALMTAYRSALGMAS